MLVLCWPVAAGPTTRLLLFQPGCAHTVPLFSSLTFCIPFLPLFLLLFLLLLLFIFLTFSYCHLLFTSAFIFSFHLSLPPPSAIFMCFSISYSPSSFSTTSITKSPTEQPYVHLYTTIQTYFLLKVKCFQMWKQCTSVFSTNNYFIICVRCHIVILFYPALLCGSRSADSSTDAQNAEDWSFPFTDVWFVRVLEAI